MASRNGRAANRGSLVRQRHGNQGSPQNEIIIPLLQNQQVIQVKESPDERTNPPLTQKWVKKNSIFQNEFKKKVENFESLNPQIGNHFNVSRQAHRQTKLQPLSTI